LATLRAMPLVGCMSAVMGGAKCGPGALSAGISAAAGPLIDGRGFSVGSLVANAVVGGLASLAGGGKFANGAITAAYGYLFNYLSHVHRSPTLEAMAGSDIKWQQQTDLANAVSDVDWLPGASNGDRAYMHGMCQVVQSASVCQSRIQEYQDSLWEQKSLQGLAGLLHLLQDSYAPGHIGRQEWDGSYANDIPGTLKHLWGDGMPPQVTRDMIVDDSRQLIMGYDQYCGGCIRNYNRFGK